MKATMLKTALLATLLVAPACDSPKEEPPADTPAAVPGKKEIAKEVAKGVKDVVTKKGPKWTFEYEGDLKGKVQGGIMTAMSVGSNTTVAGGAMTPDRKGKATESFTLVLMNAKSDKPVPQLKLTLADGTKCSPDFEGEDFGTVKFHDANAKTFHAELAGKLKCGPKGGERDKKVTYKATLKK